MMRYRNSNFGFSLLELIAAIVIASTVAVIGIHYLRPAGTLSHQRSCDLTRQLLQNDVQRYFETTGRLPTADLRPLATPLYSGTALPVCPETGEAYRLDRSGTVGCGTHEATRTN